ncbi:Serine arginine repetitive matrix protein [Aphelenchoides bicaudatus]|nr:Serine arginine repetitive matrix protein [Aphelenchoides bicaudatus]
MSSGFYRGTNIDQDVRYSDKEKKLLKQMKFENSLETKIDVKRVNIEVIKPWIAAKINALLGMEDDVVTEYVFTQLEEKNLNPKVMQINLTGFLNARRSREFMGELWNILCEAQNSPDGIPVSMINKKMEELKATATGRRDVPMAKATENDWRNRYQSLTGGRYGKEVDYSSHPGAADEINAEPESPSNRRWRRERTPDDLPIPRRKRGDEEKRVDRDRERSDRHADRHGDRHRGDRRSRSPDRRRNQSRSPDRRRRDRSRSPDRRRERRRTPSPLRKKFTEERKSRRSRSDSPDEKQRSSSSPPKSEKKRKRHSSGSSDDERKSKKKKHKKEKKHKHDRE